MVAPQSGEASAACAGLALADGTSRGSAAHSRWRWPLFVALGVALSVFLIVFVVLGVIVSLQPRQYAATARVIIDSEPFKPGKDITEQSRRQREVITSPRILSVVADELDLKHRWASRGNGAELSGDEVYTRLRSGLEVRLVPHTRLLEIRYFGAAPQEAADIANKITRTYCSLGSNGHSPIPELVDPAEPPLRHSRPNEFRFIALGAVLAHLLGLLAGGLTWWFVPVAAKSGVPAA